jgi:hypothetical protein
MRNTRGSGCPRGDAAGPQMISRPSEAGRPDGAPAACIALGLAGASGRYLKSNVEFPSGENRWHAGGDTLPTIADMAITGGKRCWFEQRKFRLDIYLRTPW